LTVLNKVFMLNRNYRKKVGHRISNPFRYSNYANSFSS